MTIHTDCFELSLIFAGIVIEKQQIVLKKTENIVELVVPSYIHLFARQHRNKDLDQKIIDSLKYKSWVKTQKVPPCCQLEVASDDLHDS